MKWLLINSLLLVASYGYSLPAHAIYISVISIEHGDGASSASIEFKIFKDDLRDAVLHHTQNRYGIDETENTDYQKDILKYLNNQFKLQINHIAVSLAFQSIEAQGEAVFIATRADVPSHWRKVLIETGLLSELFPTQQNMIQYQDGGIRQFARLNIHEKRVVFE